MYPDEFGSITPPVRRIERPGIVIHMTLAEYLHLRDHPEVDLEWRRRMAEIDESRSLRERLQLGRLLAG